MSNDGKPEESAFQMGQEELQSYLDDMVAAVGGHVHRCHVCAYDKFYFAGTNPPKAFISLGTGNEPHMIPEGQLIALWIACVNCGAVTLFDLKAIETWREKKGRSNG